MIIVAVSLLLASLQASGGGMDSRPAAAAGCTVVAERYLFAADAANRYQALEIAEHEVGISNRLTSQRLAAARNVREHTRQFLTSSGCSAAALVPAYSRYVPPARACAAVEGGGDPGADYRGCDPTAWRD